MGEAYVEAMNPRLFTVNYLQCQKGFKTKTRLFDTPYFLYVHKGKGKFIIGENQYHCAQGDLFFCPPKVANTIVADDEDPYLLSGIDFKFSGERPDLNVPIGFLEHLNIANHQQFLWILMELISRVRIDDKNYSSYVQTLFKAWILLVNNLSGNDKNASVLDEIIDFLAENYNKNISLNETAHKFGYHPNHVNRLFKNRFKTTIKQYHSDIRIKKAAQLLLYSSYTVGEIANVCGYEDINYFSRVFKQKTACSPRQYRSKHL